MSKFDENLADQVVGEAASIPDKDAISEAAVKQLPHPQYDQETAGTKEKTWYRFKKERT